MADGDYERRTAREAELKRYARLIEQARAKSVSRQDAEEDGSTCKEAPCFGRSPLGDVLV